MTMRERLLARWRAEFGPSGPRAELAIDVLMAELGEPTAFMLEAGALAYDLSDIVPAKTRLKYAFQAMISEAGKGG